LFTSSTKENTLNSSSSVIYTYKAHDMMPHDIFSKGPIFSVFREQRIIVMMIRKMLRA
jgi:hypothetical protein